MVLMAAQTTTFFEDDEQMRIPHVTVIQLQVEGIMTIGDLAGFEKVSLEQQKQTFYTVQKESSPTQALMLLLEQLFQCLPLPVVKIPRRGFLGLATSPDTTIQWAET